jgi:hypothetical protein
MMNGPVAILKLDELVSRYVPLSKGEESATHATVEVYYPDEDVGCEQEVLSKLRCVLNDEQGNY